MSKAKGSGFGSLTTGAQPVRAGAQLGLGGGVGSGTENKKYPFNYQAVVVQ